MRQSIITRVWVVLAMVAAPIAAQSVRYTVTVDPNQRAFRVRAEFPVPQGRDTFLVSLPAWTAGSYGIENYARFVRTFAARSGDGRQLAWDKLDKDTWRIVTGGAQAVTVELVTNPDSVNLTMSAVLPGFAFMNGTNLFLYPEGSDYQFPADVTLELPPGWRVATGLDPVAAGRYHAANYHDLVDAPFFMGRFWMDSVIVDGKPIRFAMYPDSAMAPAVWDTLSAAIRGIATVQNRIMGGPPYESYTVLFYAPTSDMQWGGGLEHHNSQFDAMPGQAFATNRALGRLGGFTRPLLSHEFFHLWNVKRIRPAELWPYEYSHEQYTPLLWWSEGVTDYYSDVTLARAGIWSVDRFVNSVSNNINQVEGARERVAAEDASIDTWIEPTWVEESQYYYPKGSLLGLMLDIRIREATNNQHSLDDVMRRLFSDYYRQNRGFTTQDLLGIIRPWYAGVDDFYVRYINGREPLPYAEILPRAGIAVSQRDVPGKRPGDARGSIVVSREASPTPQAAALLWAITGGQAGGRVGGQ